jgi:hypothetical protein
MFNYYTFITHPTALQSIGKCVILYALKRLFSKWGPRNASGPQHFIPHLYKLGAKTGLDDGKEFGSRQRQHIFLFSKSPERLWGPPCHLMGNRGSVPWVKRAGAWSRKLTPSSAEVKNEWTYNSTPPTCLTTWIGKKITFYLLLWVRMKRKILIINLKKPCVLYIGRAYRYPPDVTFYIYFFQQI